MCGCFHGGTNTQTETAPGLRMVGQNRYIRSRSDLIRQHKQIPVFIFTSDILGCNLEEF
jgi:hypothetical protein